MNRSVVTVLLAATMALGPTAVYAQDDAKGSSRWGLDVEQGRLSAALHGDALDDPRQFQQIDTDDVRSWARNRLRLSRQPADHRADGMSWEAVVVQEAHILGAGARAGVRLNQDEGPVGQRYPFDVQNTQHRRWQVTAQFHRTAHLAWLADEPLRWYAGINLLAVDRYKAINASGVLHDMVSGDLGLQAHSSSNELGGTSAFIQPSKPLGWGLTLNLGVQGGQPDQAQWRLDVRDLGPRVKLRHVLGDDKSANTNTLSFDADGFVNFAPVVQGQYSDRAASLRIEPEWTAHAAHPLGRHGQAVVGGAWHGARQEISLGYQHQWGAHRLSVTGHALRDMPFSVGLRWEMPHASLGWRADRISAGKARIWVLEGRLNF